MVNHAADAESHANDAKQVPGLAPGMKEMLEALIDIARSLAEIDKRIRNLEQQRGR